MRPRTSSDVAAATKYPTDHQPEVALRDPVLEAVRVEQRNGDAGRREDEDERATGDDERHPQRRRMDLPRAGARRAK
jgi:hypothetical protein